ncbi:MAG: YggS family pyridoxal phosphate-dependent enzyme [Dehalococcoidia bacterium]
MMVADDLQAQVRANVLRIHARVAAAAERAGRNPASVTLIAVSKTFPPAAIAAAVAAGVSNIGENRVQEAEAKRQALDAAGVRPVWRLIGHLQSNKVKTALQVFDTLDAIDSLRLAETVSRHAVATVPVLIEINVAGEASKFGFTIEEAADAAERIAALPRLDVRGFMTVAPPAADPEAVRPVFRRLRELGDRCGLPDLSMGMSHDFEVAIEEGATMVRVGRAIFGERADPAPR